ncbi:hypothetical protein N473_21930 [Pseudoalteromonas luteoviolacea CPMOR-1]|uniref:Superoxide dismutase [Cu-Zn] n=1 Tax=Pseudoalteromonas luteoviolacea CPMOR-1 TaxID=1365248 RepID=A0A162AMF1_9GAMM|nr:superoxide dismutase family protein [Pseudoalteromonas luteoviolacea]KZN61850.1 hypothetical protein N473_21930 [Pseudoalteromonas luteoviolacea CPMOR-1]
MKKAFSTVGITALLCAAISTHAQATYQIGEVAHSKIINNQGEQIGTAHYTQGNEGVVIEIIAQKLPAGKHGMHFHEVGTCVDQHHFKKAKGHIMPSGKPHGYYHPGGPHEGNLPNLIVRKDGTVHVELYTELVSISGRGNKPALLDDNGSVLMIHANEDDHLTQPIGGSGSRIGCGIVIAGK